MKGGITAEFRATGMPVAETDDDHLRRSPR